MKRAASLIWVQSWSGPALLVCCILFMTSSFAACSWMDQVTEANDAIKQMLASQQSRLKLMDQKVVMLQLQIFEVEKTQNILTSLALCPNPVVREFVQRCKAGNGECSGSNMEMALMEMTRFPHVLVPYRLNEDPLLMVPPRNHQVKLLASSFNRRMSTTRLLVVALPFSLNRTDQADAERLGSKFREFFKSSVYAAYHPNEAPLAALDATTVSCAQRAEILRRYRKIKEDQRFPGEPADNERQTVIWAFLVDC